MTTKRHIFYSFHYKPDCWRASTVRSIGTIEGNRPVTDNEWEKITSAGENTIKKWINEQLEYRSCTIVLVGSNTANRKWINYEIVKSWDKGIGVVGIYIHGLKNSLGETSKKGENPFDYIGYGDSGKKLSEMVKCYDPAGYNSKEKYEWISKYIAAAVEEAIEIRNKN